MSDKMRLECVLELMKEKEHIKLYKTGNDKMPIIYAIESLRGKRLGKKIWDIFKEHKDEYIFCNKTTTYTDILFAKKKDIDKWIEENLTKKEKRSLPWKHTILDFEIEDYLKSKDIIMAKEHGSLMDFLNRKIQKQRIEKEKQEEQKALDLLEQIL